MAAKLFELAGKRVYVAGHNGMVGSAIVRRLKVMPCEVITAGRDEVDLERQDQAEAFLAARRPGVVIVASAKVGGIPANDAYPAEFGESEGRCHHFVKFAAGGPQGPSGPPDGQGMCKW